MKFIWYSLGVTVACFTLMQFTAAISLGWHIGAMTSLYLLSSAL